MKRLSTGLIVCCMILSAGAERASKVQPSYVSQSNFMGMSCDMLAGEMYNVERQLFETSAAQDRAATTDAWATGIGLVLFWPALFALAVTDDQRERLSSLKGNYDALQGAMTSQRCPSARRYVPAGGQSSSDSYFSTIG